MANQSQFGAGQVIGKGSGLSGLRGFLTATGPRETGVGLMAMGVVRSATAPLPFDALPIVRGSWYLIRML
jgi:hypothetical protein